MQMNRAVASAFRTYLSSVFLPLAGLDGRRSDGWTAAGEATELAYLQPLPIGLAGRTAIVLGLALAVKLCWVWS